MLVASLQAAHLGFCAVALEHKIVQRATIGVLNAIYEEDFLGFSYGFRPKRGQHVRERCHHRVSQDRARRLGSGHAYIYFEDGQAKRSGSFPLFLSRGGLG